MNENDLKLVRAIEDDERYEHTLGCVATAEKLAQRYGEDVDMAKTAACYHDITRRMDRKSQLKILKKYGIIVDRSEATGPALLHAVTAAALAEHDYGLSPEIVSAIRWHTTGKPNMSKLDKIIWLADYIEPGRDFRGVDDVRNVAYDDLDKAMIIALTRSVDHLKKLGNAVCPKTAETLKYLLDTQKDHTLE